MTGFYSTYKVLIDWYQSNGLNLWDFESGTQGWQVGGSVPPTIAQYPTGPYQGSYSLLMQFDQFLPFTFNSSSNGFNSGKFGTFGQENAPDVFTFNDGAKGFDTGRFGFSELSDPSEHLPYVYNTVTGLQVGKTYTLKCQANVASGFGQPVTMSIGGVEDASVLTSSTWEELSVTFTATATSHEVRVTATSSPTADGRLTQVDAFSLVGAFDDVTSRVLSKRTAVTFSRGRDQSRALSPSRPGDGALEVHNRDGRFSPDNVGSPLYGQLAPGADVSITAQPDGENARNLFFGYIDGYEISPNIDKQAVDFTLGDGMSLLAQINISTEVFSGMTTGELIGKVLDYAGWPAQARDLDSGATPVQYWHEEGTDALEAIQKLVDSEGPPAIVYVDGAGNFVFRDRHHRFTRTASTTSQATFSPSTITGVEPVFQAPLTYNVGWQDLVNTVSFSVETRGIAAPAEVQFSNRKPQVWKTTETFSLVAGQSKVFDVKTDNPFINAQLPLTAAGWEDYAVLSGSVSVSLSRTSGQSLRITVQCTAGPAVIQGMALRADEITVLSTEIVTVSDAASVASHKTRNFSGNGPVWANIHDATAIAGQIIATRSTRNPTIEFRVSNGSTERVTQIMDRQISDRIHLSEPAQSFINDDFFVESVAHSISEAGKYHEVTFGCERVPVTATNPFTFNDAGKGFDTGRFDYDGRSDPATLFVLDVSDLDEGVLGF